ncbi:MAG: hypothetical protein JSV49_08465 [Thermoplasmata archaeon]|nr:MAG: hypothetical protein JSV49_08465 [Thermoplasmata archaeon]
MEPQTEEEDNDVKSKGYFEELGYDPYSARTRPEPEEVDVVKKKLERPGGRRSRSRISIRSIVLIIGLILVLTSTVFAFNSIETGEPESLADTTEYRIFQAVLTSEELNCDYGPGGMYFDAGKLMSLSGTVLKNSLLQDGVMGDDYQFVIEVIDISNYPVHYNRTHSEGNAIQTSPLPEGGAGIDVVTFESGVNIFVDRNEIHTAKFIIHIWKG